MLTVANMNKTLTFIKAATTKHATKIVDIGMIHMFSIISMCSSMIVTFVRNPRKRAALVFFNPSTNCQNAAN